MASEGIVSGGAYYNEKTRMPRNGCETSSRPDTSRPAKLTSAISERSSPTTCAGSRNATSLLASASGPTPCDSPAGPTTDLFGQAVAHAMGRLRAYGNAIVAQVAQAFIEAYMRAEGLSA